MKLHSEFQITDHSLPPDASYPFHITAKRYIKSFENATPSPGFTLILLHSTGFHKEIWEPTLEEICSLLQEESKGIISQAWSIECPNHGASSTLNEAALSLPENKLNFTCGKYAQAVHRFLCSDAPGIDFKKHKLIGIGHSLGGVAMANLQTLFPILPFQTVILVEPMLSPKGPEVLEKLRYDLVRRAYERRDVWPDRETALKAMKEHKRTRNWDPRVLETYVRYGLKTHHGAQFEHTPYNGVSLCCSRDEEAAMYRDSDGPTKPLIHLNKACFRLPVHIVFGTRNDYIPREVHESLIDPSSARRFASISYIPDSGHLIPQEAPIGLAKCVVGIILEFQRSRVCRTGVSRL